MSSTLESKNDPEMLTSQEMQMQTILDEFVVSEPVAVIYTPVMIKIPIKNCQKIFSTNAILNAKNDKPTSTTTISSI